MESHMPCSWTGYTNRQVLIYLAAKIHYHHHVISWPSSPKAVISENLSMCYKKGGGVGRKVEEQKKSKDRRGARVRVECQGRYHRV